MGDCGCVGCIATAAAACISEPQCLQNLSPDGFGFQHAGQVSNSSAAIFVDAAGASAISWGVSLCQHSRQNSASGLFDADPQAGQLIEASWKLSGSYWSFCPYWVYRSLATESLTCFVEACWFNSAHRSGLTGELLVVFCLSLRRGYIGHDLGL